MHCLRNYKGFQVDAQATKVPQGAYTSSVTLMLDNQMKRTFDLPACGDLSNEQEALDQALQYGLDLLDGLVPSFDPADMLGKPGDA